MKARKLLYTMIIAAAGFTVLPGCVGDLDVQPLDETVLTGERAYTTAEDYENALAKLYAIWALSGQDDPGSADINIGDAGNTTLVRSYWLCQEQPTDEMKNSDNKDWCAPMNNMAWNTSKVEPIEACYQRSMYIVALTNDFLKHLPDAPAGIDQTSFNAQARFCRALAYYVLMDMFGNPPFITESNYSLTPQQIGRAGIFNYIESELKAIAGALPVRNTGNDRGRADQGSVYTLLARMYLNAKEFTGTERYADCIAACQQVFNCGYTLCPEYNALFCGDNTEYSGAANEIIFPILMDSDETQTWANFISSSRPSEATDEIEAMGEGKDAAKYRHCYTEWGSREGWAQYRSSGALIDFFEFQDNNDKVSTEILDKRGIFRSMTYRNDEATGQKVVLTQHIQTDPIGTYHAEAWWVYKFDNRDHTGQPLDNKYNSTPSAALWMCMDFPLMRLGDVYLMYAEAVARSNDNQNMQDAVDKVNELRKRGYGEANYTGQRVIDAGWLKASAVVGGSDKTVEFGNILNERTRELYWEGQRRTDLIRFGLFTGSDYTWDFKGGVPSGTGVQDYYKLYPIPETDLSANGALQQNEGYKRY